MPTRQPRLLYRASITPGRALSAALALLACLGVNAVQAAAPYRGRTVDDVLDELAAAARLQLVYTSAVIPATATVTAEPSAGPALESIAQILAPLGLKLQPIEGRIYAVVPATDLQAAPRSAPALPGTRGDLRDEPLAAVVVTASRYSLASDAPDVHTFLSQDELDALPRLAEDALKVVHRLPGAASNGLAGLAHMRGGDTNETLVLLDGLPLYEPFHLRLLQSPASVLDERIVDGIDVYAGGFTADYGDRMSAIINARSLRPDADAYYELGLSLMHTNALASQRFADGRGQWLVSFRRSNLDEIADLSDSTLGEPKYMDGFARIDYQWSPSTRGSLHTLLASDQAEITNSAGTEHADAEYSNAYVWGTLTHDWSARLGTSAIVSFTDVAAEREADVFEPGKRIGTVEDQRDYDVLGLKLDASYATERWLQRGGIDVRWLAATYDYVGSVDFAADYPFPDAPAQDISRALAPRPSGEHVAVYYTVRGKLTDALTAELGLRWDEQTYGADADNQLAPRLNLAWNVDADTRLLASVGRFMQFQGIEELPVEDGVTTFSPAQRADHYIVGLERDLASAYTLRIETYRKNYGDLRTRFESLYDPLSLAPELRWDRTAIAPSSAIAEGAELLLTRRPVDAWSGWFSYAWARVDDRVEGRDVRRSWDQTHTLNLGALWSAGPWQATLAAQYHTGWPVTPIGLDAAGQVVLGPRNGSRYADYGSVDARLSYEWTLPRGTLTVHGELTNALDRRNPCCTDIEYTVVDGTPTLERELRHWLPLVPSVGVLWKF
jgi:hypothetical protein